MWKGKFLKNKYFKTQRSRNQKSFKIQWRFTFFESWIVLKAFQIVVPVVKPMLFVTHVKHCHYFDSVSCPYMPGDW